MGDRERAAKRGDNRVRIVRAMPPRWERVLPPDRVRVVLERGRLIVGRGTRETALDLRRYGAGLDADRLTDIVDERLFFHDLASALLPLVVDEASIYASSLKGQQKELGELLAWIHANQATDGLIILGLLFAAEAPAVALVVVVLGVTIGFHLVPEQKKKEEEADETTGDGAEDESSDGIIFQRDLPERLNGVLLEILECLDATLIVRNGPRSTQVLLAPPSEQVVPIALLFER